MACPRADDAEVTGKNLVPARRFRRISRLRHLPDWHSALPAQDRWRASHPRSASRQQEKPAMKLNSLLTAACVLAASVGQADSPRVSRPQPLDIEMFYQFSATDEDAEVTIGVESPDYPIDHLVIVAPRGRIVATVDSKDRLGLAEVELESAEPSVEEVQRAYPEGNYMFFGEAVDGTRLFGRVTLAHEVVGAPDFFQFSPCGEEVDASSEVTIAWNTVAGAEGGYEIIIEQDDTGANLRVTQNADRTSFVIPQGFLAAGLEYEIEMKSVSAGGNKTSASCEFSTQ
jgi:hypothetical protein